MRKKGWHISEEHKQKIRESNARRIFSRETLKKMSESSKGRHVSEETRQKLKEARKRRVFSLETRHKIGEAHKGHVVTSDTRQKISNAKKGKKPIHPMSIETRAKLSKSLMGHNVSIETRNKISEKRKGKYSGKNSPTYGKTRPREIIEKIIESNKRRRGEKSSLWIDGRTPVNKAIRGSVEYKLWRKSVFERDNYTCVLCGQRGGDKHADHIKPFAHYPELRFALNNGRTLCVPCHRKTDTYGASYRMKI
jgi:hypothetical protein